MKKEMRGARKEPVSHTLFRKHLAELGLEFMTEVRVCPERKWRWDFVLTNQRVAIEIDGFFKGRHGAGWGADNEKQNMGVMLGWRVLRFSTGAVLKGEAKAFLAEWLTPIGGKGG